MIYLEILKDIAAIIIVVSLGKDCASFRIWKANLQTARVSVRKMETLWMVTVKLMWKNMKIAQNIENWNEIM